MHTCLPIRLPAPTRLDSGASMAILIPNAEMIRLAGLAFHGPHNHLRHRVVLLAACSGAQDFRRSRAWELAGCSLHLPRTGRLLLPSELRSGLRRPADMSCHMLPHSSSFIGPIDVSL